MKYEGLRRWVLIVSIFTAGATISRGLILTFFYDIFESCLTRTPGVEPTLVCEYGPQTLLNVIAGLFFLAAGYALLHKTTGLVRKNWLVLLAVIYILMMMGSWRLLNEISQNFSIVQGPVTWTEYLFVLYVNLEMVIVSSVIALFYNFTVATDRKAIPEESRNAPRDLPSSSKAAVSTSSKTTKKSPAKKKTAKKSSAKKSTAKKTSKKTSKK